jgi:hypothetical protein
MNTTLSYQAGVAHAEDMLRQAANGRLAAQAGARPRFWRSFTRRPAGQAQSRAILGVDQPPLPARRAAVAGGSER